MNLARVITLRTMVLALLWALPMLVYLTIGLAALYQTGWLGWIALSLPVVWLLAWVVGRSWPPPSLPQSRLVQPLTPREFWTPQDAQALQVVQRFRESLPDIDRISIADPSRYIADAQALSQKLAEHYYSASAAHAYRPLTVIEILSVIHLSIEDLELWMLENVPGSDRITLGQMEKVPAIINAIDVGQKIFFLATSLVNPAKLLSYPLWRSAGRVTVELQNEAIRAFYQRYLQQISFYLIEVYSGRLRGGSQRYRQQFAHLSSAVHSSGGDIELVAQAETVDTAIAVMGQVKAGKSSLINALVQNSAAKISVLPETRNVQRYELKLPAHPTASPHASLSQHGDSRASLFLLDTPGYSEADISAHQRREIKQASEMADIVLLVLSAASPARQSDVEMLRELVTHYRDKRHLKPPPIIAVLTHIDQLKPVREWSPPYNWRQPHRDKERSIAAAVAYARELFGDQISGYACVYTGQTHATDNSVAEELVPLLMQHLSSGHATAVLKAFYRGLSQQRYQQLIEQLAGFLRSVIDLKR